MIGLIGRKWGRRTVIRPLEAESDGKHAFWLCVCDCGTRSTVRGDQLRSGESQSCGCYHTEALTTHGHTSRRVHGRASSEYKAYDSAKQACTNPKCFRYAICGARGIEMRFSSFEEFLAHIGLKPHADYQLRRHDPDSHFEPGNVFWKPLRRPRKTYTRKFCSSNSRSTKKG
jgi:hypothetical protein